MPSLSTFIQQSICSPSDNSQTKEERRKEDRRRNERKRIQIGKEEVKLSLFWGDMILYTENPKDTTRKLLELFNQFSKVVGCKTNM